MALIGIHKKNPVAFNEPKKLSLIWHYLQWGQLGRQQETCPGLEFHSIKYLLGQWVVFFVALICMKGLVDGVSKTGFDFYWLNSSFQPIDLSIIIARIGFTSSLLLLNTVIGKAEGGDVSANCLIMQAVELPMQSTAKSLKVITIMIDNSPFLVCGEIFAYFGIKHLRIRWNLALGAKSNMRRVEKLQSFSPLWSWSYHNPKATLEWSPKALLMLVEGKRRCDATHGMTFGMGRHGEGGRRNTHHCHVTWLE